MAPVTFRAPPPLAIPCSNSFTRALPPTTQPRHNHQVHRQIPPKICAGAIAGRPGLRERWGGLNLPYFWCHLALQCLLYDEPALEARLTIRTAADGPLFRATHFETCGAGDDSSPRKRANSAKTARDLASRGLRPEDRWFIKLVGPERDAVEDLIRRGDYEPGSALIGIAAAPSFHPHGPMAGPVPAGAVSPSPAFPLEKEYRSSYRPLHEPIAVLAP